MVKSLFGSPAKSSSSSQSGYDVLPSWAKQGFRDISGLTSGVLDNPEDYFRPIGLTPEEQAAQQMLMPENFTQSIEQYMSPYRDIVFEDINRAFEQGALANLNRGANEAGAFGGTRYQSGQYDVGRAQMDALRQASQAAFETALGQRQQGLANLLGFGGLQRELDMAQRQAIPAAAQFATGIYSPLLSSSVTTSMERGKDEGILGKIAGFAGSAGGGMQGASMMGFSDSRLKKDIEYIGEENGHNIYEFSYIWDDGRYQGVMAQEVEETMPEAVSFIGDYMVVDYGKIGVEMRRV